MMSDRPRAPRSNAVLLKSRDKDKLRGAFADLMARCREQARAHPRMAKQAAEEAEVIGRLLEDKLMQADAALEAASAHFRLGAIAASRDKLAQALPVFEASGAAAKLVRCYIGYTNLLVADSYYSLALAVASKALTLDAASAADRARFYLASAIAMAGLMDLEGARRVMDEHAIPNARSSGDRDATLQMLNVAVRFEAMYFCLAKGIPFEPAAGMDQSRASESPHVYLDRAAGMIAEIRNHLSPEDIHGNIWALDSEAWIVALRDGIDAARPLLERALALCGDQHGRAALRVKTTLGMGYRVANRPAEALPWLEEARRLASAAQEGGAIRNMDFELSLVYEALGRPIEALRALRSFTSLQTRKVMNATTWFTQLDDRRRFGPAPDLERVRAGLLRSIEPAHLRRAIRYIEANLDQPLSVHMLAEQCAVSVKTLQNAFKRHRGVTPGAAIRQLRMRKAQTLVRETSLTMAAIARQLGYTTASNFTRDYRRQFGVSPTFVRERETAPRPEATSGIPAVPATESPVSHGRGSYRRASTSAPGIETQADEPLVARREGGKPRVNE